MTYMKRNQRQACERRTSRACGRPRVDVVLEVLERRAMLSAATIDRGALVIEGTRRSDEVVIGTYDDRVEVSVNGETRSLARGAFNRFRIDVGAGDDRVMFI